MSNFKKIGILREGKTPPDKRVTLSPKHCRELLDKYPQLDLVVQRSPIRAFTDDEYAQLNIPLVDSLEDREIIIGVKEVPIEQLIENKAYLFFSHTTKKQPYNKGLLQAILDKNITLLDHELLEEAGNRVIAFGRFAGIVGAYNGLRAYCLQEMNITLKSAHECHDQEEMQAQLQTVEFPKSLRIILSGSGRVGGGAVEVLESAGFMAIDIETMRSRSNQQPCYHVLDTEDLYRHKTRNDFNKAEFYTDPSLYNSILESELKSAHIYIACHYWNPKGPMLLTHEGLENREDLCVVADISCDIKRPIASTLRASTIANPFFGYDPKTDSEVAFGSPNSVGIMSVDNLPCELPRDSSLAFGQQFIDFVASSMIEGDKHGMLQNATIASEGSLSQKYAYLAEWLAED